MTARADESSDKLKARVDELEEELSRERRRSKALQEVGLALGSTLDLDQLLELILQKITELLRADRATLYLLDEQRKRLLSRIMIGNEARSIELPLGEGIAGHVAKVGKTVRVRDAYRDKRFNPDTDTVTGYRTRSILAAPMKNHVGRTIGVIQVLNKHADEKTIAKKSKRAPKKQASAPPELYYGEFSSDDEELLTALATQAAVSIDNSRLFLSVIQKNMQLVDTKEQLEQRVADLKVLFELESAMGRATTIEELSRAVVGSAARACNARAGGMLVDEGEAGLWLYFIDASARPLPAAGDEQGIEVKRLPVKRGEGILGWALQHNTAASVPPAPVRALPPAGGSAASAADGAIPLTDDVEIVPPISRQRASVAGMAISSAIAVPLEGTDDQAIGAIALYNSKKPLGFTQDDRSMLRLVSANASTSLQLFRSHMEQEKSARLSAIGRLISGVMHDMRTPLTVISGYVQLMATARDEPARNEYMRIILKQFDTISAMQREVLEFARGERSILLRKVYLTRFFGDIETQLRQELASRNEEGTGSRPGRVELVMQIDDRTTARFDEAKITRVLHNLVRNAYEAMAERGGIVTVRVHREAGDLLITVSDTGRGIPEEVKQRLFQSFVTAGKRGGTGLGLAIVKKIVDEHGGTIDVESTDHGARFTLRLPQDEPARTGTGIEKAPASG
ncbi:MAG: GAF domain-containing protein [Polyangiaceae bacterium]